MALVSIDVGSEGLTAEINPTAEWKEGDCLSLTVSTTWGEGERYMHDSLTFHGSGANLRAAVGHLAKQLGGTVAWPAKQ